MIENDAKAGIAVLTLILVASGCGSGGGTSSTDVSFTPNQAIAIQNFSSYPGRVYEGQPATIRLSVQNTGQATAQDVVARLYGAPINWGEENNARSFSGDSKHITLSTDLRPADAEAGVPSVPQQLSWSLTPPNLGDRNIDYNFKTRVFFKYSTSAQSEIQLVRQDEFRNQGMTKSQPTLDNSAGPISLQVRTRTPLIYYQDSVDYNSNICFIVKNVGDGTPFITGSGDNAVGQYYKNLGDKTNKVQLTIDDVGGVEFSASDGSETNSGNSWQTTVEIIGGRGIQCFDMSLPDLTTTDISQTVPITVSADYGYFKDDETQVTVLGSSNR